MQLLDLPEAQPCGSNYNFLSTLQTTAKSMNQVFNNVNITSENKFISEANLTLFTPLEYII